MRAFLRHRRQLHGECEVTELRATKHDVAEGVAGDTVERIELDLEALEVIVPRGEQGDETARANAWDGLCCLVATQA